MGPQTLDKLSTKLVITCRFVAKRLARRRIIRPAHAFMPTEVHVLRMSWLTS